jgi:hypothetical protein
MLKSSKEGARLTKLSLQVLSTRPEIAEHEPNAGHCHDCEKEYTDKHRERKSGIS